MHFDADVMIIGGGPAGLMAAETARAAGLDVLVLERMGSCGRKFLIAGKGGLNLTHAEPKAQFVQRYSDAQAQVARWLAHFDADALRAFARGLGIETMIGSSGRVFPNDLKAGPMMRSWLKRLRAQGVRFAYHTRCIGIQAADGGIAVQTESSTEADTATLVQAQVRARAVVLAMGGGSWAKLGSDGSWVQMLQAAGLAIAPLLPSNCGYALAWSAALQKFAGTPIKSVSARVLPGAARRGELMLSEYGLEGSLLYALSADIRSAIAQHGFATLHIDLAPDIAASTLLAKLQAARPGQTLSERCANLSAVKVALFFEGSSAAERAQLALDPHATLDRIKAFALKLQGARPIDEAISTAGGVLLDQLDDQLMSRQKPGLFFAGEMLAWDAPTGGYLLTACFASGFVAGEGVARYLASAS
jgi:uncharacterized flavoprotein (TIGR03862 family)